MPLQTTKPVEVVRKIKIQIGDEWIERSFGQGISRDQAMRLARETLESLK